MQPPVRPEALEGRRRNRLNLGAGDLIVESEIINVASGASLTTTGTVTLTAADDQSGIDVVGVVGAVPIATISIANGP